MDKVNYDSQVGEWTLRGARLSIGLCDTRGGCFESVRLSVITPDIYPPVWF